ncbi:MAG TPA: DUF2950 domain-containing protein [Burkholderiaceae bacterium]|nr:DUF2950 domain-containing protein [Burkholderiaceae bacterium]
MKAPLFFAALPCARFVLSVAACAALGFGAPAARAQKVFESPDAAMTAFGEAVATNNDEGLKSVLGADFRDFIPPVPEESRLRFLSSWARAHSIKTVDDTHAEIAVGDDGWTLPIPIVKTAKGWQFDPPAGAEEMRVRRIGKNELAAIQTMLAICDAQAEYAQMNRDGKGVLAYASRLTSSPGKRDGLYWPTQSGEPPSPLGPAFVAAGRLASPDGYNGYFYKLLVAQGSHAPGGAYSYVVGGKLFGGFAVIAWPARYQETGIKTFIVSHDEQVYEQDLGPGTAAKAAAIRSFDPGPGWSKVSP